MHFYPSTGAVSAPYPAYCRLTLFGGGAEIKSVVIDGARLSQPDGLYLDDAFDRLKEVTGLFGLIVELSTPQPRVDLSHSGCVIEFHSPLHLSRFWPTRLLKSGQPEQRGPLPLIKDPYQVASLLVANATPQPITPPVVVGRMKADESFEVGSLKGTALSPFTVKEVPLPEDFFDESPAQPCSYGLLRLGSVGVLETLSPMTAVAVLYRDASNGQPVSVCSL